MSKLLRKPSYVGIQVGRPTEVVTGEEWTVAVYSLQRHVYSSAATWAVEETVFGCDKHEVEFDCIVAISPKARYFLCLL